MAAERSRFTVCMGSSDRMPSGSAESSWQAMENRCRQRLLPAQKSGQDTIVPIEKKPRKYFKGMLDALQTIRRHFSDKIFTAKDLNQYGPFYACCCSDLRKKGYIEIVQEGPNHYHPTTYKLKQ